MRIFLCALLAFVRLIAEEPAHPAPEPSSLANITAQPSAIVNGCVNAVTGDYIETSTDYTLSGIDPLSITRSCISSETGYDTLGYAWHLGLGSTLQVLQPDGITFAKSPHQGKSDYSRLYLTEPSGGTICFLGSGWAKRFKPCLSKTSWTNAASTLSGKTNLRNLEVEYDKEHDRWYVYAGDGSKRTYKRIFEQQSNLQRGQYNYHYRDYHITEERLPSGNRVHYVYCKDAPKLLRKIVTTNHNNTRTINFIRFDQLPHHQWIKHPQISLSTSDGKTVTFRYRFLDHKRFQLGSVDHPDLPEESFHYNSDRQLTRCSYHERDSYLATTYDHHKRVHSQESPAGREATHSFFYHTNRTTVVDGCGTTTRYLYNDEKRLKRIECEADGHLLAAEEFEWGHDDEAGLLQTHTLLDEHDKEVFSRTYHYDSSGNLIKQHLYGTFTGTSPKSECITLTATYSDDGFNNMLSDTDAMGRTTRYTYKPRTNLLTSRITKGKREFMTYDDCACLIESVTDDGTASDRNDLSGVTERHRTRIIPRRTAPHFGDPEEVAEYAGDTLLKRTVNTFTSEGLIASTTVYDATNSPQGTTTYSYDSHGRLRSSSDPLGSTTTYTYDDFGRLKCTRGPRPDHSVSCTYDGMHRLTARAEYVAGVKLANVFQYDCLGRKIASVDPAGKVTRYSYDGLNRIISIKLPGGAKRTFSYRHRGLTVIATDERGFATTTRYNAFGKPLSRTLPDGTTTTYQYDLAGNCIRETAPGGLTTVSTYDRFNRCTSTTNGISTTRRTYNTFHLLEEQGPTNERTLHTYDSAGRCIASSLIASDGSSARTTICTYDSLSRPATKTTGGLTTTMTYDLLSRPTYETLTDATGHLFSSKAMAYDLDGNIASTTTWEATVTTTYLPNKLPASHTDALGHTTTYSYDFHNRTKSTTQPNGVMVTESFTPRGWLASTVVRDPFGELLTERTTTYDVAGNPTAIADNATTTFEYGPCNRITAIHEPCYKTTTYTYDNAGRRAVTRHPNGVLMAYSYDTKGRLTALDDTTFTYDAADRVLTASTPNGTTTRRYNDFGELASETLETGLTTGYRYDAVGRTASITLPDGSSVTYSYSPAALESVERCAADGTECYRAAVTSRDLSGRIVDLLLPNKTALHYSYDAAGHTTAITHAAFQQSLTSYDSVGNLLSRTTTDPLTTETATYSYDFLSQLLTEPDQTYTYDGFYNRTSHNGTPYTRNALNATTDAGPRQFRYDAAGNRIADDRMTYGYDTFDRLIRAGETTYRYDAFHRRIAKRGATGTTRYLYLHDNEVGSVDDSGAIQELRILAEGPGAEIGAAIAIELQGTVYIPLHDHQGNVAVLLDMAGAVVETYRYTAFGEELVAHSGRNPWRYSSKRTDPETGFVFFGRRYYDPSIGQWLTQDPLGLKAGPNLYAYVRNAPLTHIDLYGLLEEGSSTGGGFWSGVGDFCRDTWNGFTSWCSDRWNDMRSACSGSSSGRGSAPLASRDSSHKPVQARAPPRVMPHCNDSVYQLEWTYNASFGRKDHPIRGLSFTGGVGQTSADTDAHVRMLSGMGGDSKVWYTHNQSYGAVFDAARAAVSFLCYTENEAVRALHATWNAFFDSHPGGVLLHIAHSEGAINTRNALRSYDPDLRRLIYVLAVAPGAYISSSLCAGVHHLRAENPLRDPVPRIDAIGAIRCRSTTIDLPSHPNAPLFDHAFHSPTYATRIQKTITDFYAGVGL